MGWWLHWHTDIQQLDQVGALLAVHHTDADSGDVRFQKNRFTVSVEIHDQLISDESHARGSLIVRECSLVSMNLDSTEKTLKNSDITTKRRLLERLCNLFFVITNDSVGGSLVVVNVSELLVMLEHLDQSISIFGIYTLGIICLDILDDRGENDTFITKHINRHEDVLFELRLKFSIVEQALKFELIENVDGKNRLLRLVLH